MKKTSLLLISIMMVSIILISSCSQAKTTEILEENQGYPMAENQIDQGYPIEDLAIDQGYPAAEMPPAEFGYPVVDVVRIATDASFPPYEMIDETTKELMGIDIELVKAVTTQIGLQYEFVNLPFDSLVTGLSNCQFDIAIRAIPITDEYNDLFLFSNPYLNAGQIIIVNVGTSNITDKSDLIGKIVGARSGSDSEIEAKAIDGAIYKSFDTYNLAFLDLLSGQIDAVIADNPTAMGFMEKNPGKLMSVGEVFNNEYYGIAVCKDRQDLLDKINPALQTVLDSGFIEQLAKKYLTD